MLNEAVLHGFDAANAAHRPTDIDADVAATLISNHFAMLTSPTWKMQRSESSHAIRGTGQTLQWLATDTTDDANAWFVERRPDGAAWQPGTRQADATEQVAPDMTAEGPDCKPGRSKHRAHAGRGAQQAKADGPDMQDVAGENRQQGHRAT